VFGANAKGVFFTLQQAAREVRDGGRIVVVSTGGTRMLMPGIGRYLGSKGAVEQFVRVLSRELGPRNITVNALSPSMRCRQDSRTRSCCWIATARSQPACRRSLGSAIRRRSRQSPRSWRATTGAGSRARTWVPEAAWFDTPPPAFIPGLSFLGFHSGA